jgi:diguanylate cyclase (GGDEF)-like protein
MDFIKYKRELFGRWQKYIFHMCCIIAAIVTALEIGSFFIFLHGNLLVTSIGTYILLRLVLPAGLNVFFLIIAIVVLRSKTILPVTKNYAVCFALLAETLIVSIFHNFYLFVLIIPIIPIYLSSMFADKRLVRAVFYSALCGFVFSVVLWVRWEVPFYPVMKYPTIVSVAMIHVLSYIIARNICNSMQDQIFYVWNSYHKEHELIERLRIEPLTGLYNRTALKECFVSYMAIYTAASEIHTETEELTPPQMILFDIDDFKHVNDTYGHVNGDEVLVELSSIIKRRVGGNRHAFRFGGEEFIVAFRERSAEETWQVAEDIRHLFELTEFTFTGGAERFTVSAGIAAYKLGWTKERWFQAVDDAMYKAKGSGKNRVVVYQG